MKSMHLFAGGGGGLLADLILGHEPIVAVEWDAYCCKILRERANDGWFSGLHVWEGDVRLFDPSEYKGIVDCIHAGFPCQDISQAGKQAGLGEGTRSGLYREVLRIAGVVRPRVIFLENVSAILSNGLGTVLADLAEMGYDARWCCIRASDVGAPHQRDRWWLRAERSRLSSHTKHDRDGWGKQQQTSIEETPTELAKPKHITNAPTRGECQDTKGKGFGWRNDGIGIDGNAEWEISVCSARENSTVAKPNSIGHLHRQSEINTTEGRLNAQRDATASGEGFIPNANSSQREGKCQPIGVQQERPNIGKHSWWEVESQVGLLVNGMAIKLHTSWWDREPNIGRVASGVKDWSHQLKALGNGQLPLQAALAWKLLESRA